MDLAAMMWVWQGGRVNCRLAGCLARGWLMACCCLVVETGSWCWFGATAWWLKLEADADWCCWLVVEAGSWCWFDVAVLWWKLEADADLVLLIVTCISGAGCRSLGCAYLLILLIAFPGWVSRYWMDTTHGKSQLASYFKIERFLLKHFSNFDPVSSQQPRKTSKLPIYSSLQCISLLKLVQNAFSCWFSEYWVDTTYSKCAQIWLEMVAWCHRNVWKLLVTQSIVCWKSQYGHQCKKMWSFQVWNTGFYQI